MLAFIGTFGPAIAIGASITYCSKAEPAKPPPKPPRDRPATKLKLPPLTPRSIKETISKKKSREAEGSIKSKKKSREAEGSTKSKTIHRPTSQKERSTKPKSGDRKKTSKSEKKSTELSKKADKSKEKGETEKKEEKKSDNDVKKEEHLEQKMEAPAKPCDLKVKFAASASNEAALQTVDMKMSPSELNWKESGGVRQVHIVNNSGERRAIKAKCTDNLVYRVHPVHGFIEPGESFKFDVLRNNAAGKADKLVFLTTKALNKQQARECFADKSMPTEILVLPLIPEKVEG